MRLLCLSKVNLAQAAEEVEKSSRIDVFVQFGFVVWLLERMIRCRNMTESCTEYQWGHEACLCACVPLPQPCGKCQSSAAQIAWTRLALS